MAYCSKLPERKDLEQVQHDLNQAKQDIKTAENDRTVAMAEYTRFIDENKEGPSNDPTLLRHEYTLEYGRYKIARLAAFIELYECLMESFNAGLEDKSFQDRLWILMGLYNHAQQDEIWVSSADPDIEVNC
jgi:hypothetical protein